MITVKGKKELCSTENYTTHFKSIQGFGGHDIFDRYSAVETIVERYIEPSYRDFLAQPVKEGNHILWFGKSYKDSPKRLTELEENYKTKYNELKIKTLTHYYNTIANLENDNKKEEAQVLSLGLRYVEDEFIYCYDDKLVLGVWGMQLRANVRQPIGTAVKDLYAKKKKSIEEPQESNDKTEQGPESTGETAPPNPDYKVLFNPGSKGDLEGNAELEKRKDEVITSTEIPRISAKEGYEFIGWDRDPISHPVIEDVEFTAQYKQTPAEVIPPIPWYKRFWNWLRILFVGKGCLKWLLWLLLLILLLYLLSHLFKGCNGDTGIASPIPSPINEKPWIGHDPNVGGGGIYNPGNPYEMAPTPPGYADVLPPFQGQLPPLDSSKTIRDPGTPVIISNRLNILMENDDKSILNLAKAFKAKYPDDRYKVVYYDTIIKRMQIEIPPDERLKLKSEIPINFAPEYELFVFDESLFETGYTPNDPEFSHEDKSWFLKAINAPLAWDITRGASNITIAIVDDGFSLKHPELQSKVVMPFNVWTHSKEVFAQSIDHGTHVAGTALAVIDNKKGLCGIAPGCAFMPVQTGNNQGMLTTTSILDGILYALYQGADVINVSLGIQFTGTLSESEQRNLQNNHFKEEERLWNKVMEISNKHNAVLVVAAGNENMLAGVNPMSRPKNFIVVSAVDKSNREYRKAGFSNYGEYSTISAPGVDIYSSVGNDEYQVMDGTSMAAPMLAGTVALMKSLNKDLTSDQIVCILQSTGKPADGKVGNLVQIDRALQKIKSGEFTDCDGRPKTPSIGEVQILLSWDNYNDLDLVCTDPNNETIWFKNKSISSRGKLEIDMNANYPDSKTPIENIYWPSNGAPQGRYNVYLVYYKKHIAINETPYKITVKYGDKTDTYTGKIKREDNSLSVCSFNLGNIEDTNPPSPGINKDALLKEREDLQKKLDQINRELRDVQNSVKFNK